MVDEVSDDKDSVEHKPIPQAGAEKDERAWREETHLRRSAARVLQAARIEEVLAEHEGVGVLLPSLVAIIDQKRLVQEARAVWDAIRVKSDHPRVRLPFAPEDDLAFLKLSAIDVAAATS